MGISLSSNAFAPEHPIPAKYTGDGQNSSPPLSWDKLPPDTEELALIVEDPDAPTAEPFVHWVVYKIPVEAPGLPEHVKKSQSTGTVVQGKNDFGHIGYDGPAPPPGHGTHRYRFRLYALDKPLEVEAGLDNKSLIASMAGHIIDTGDLVGTYERTG